MNPVMAQIHICRRQKNLDLTAECSFQAMRQGFFQVSCLLLFPVTHFFLNLENSSQVSDSYSGTFVQPTVKANVIQQKMPNTFYGYPQTEGYNQISQLEGQKYPQGILTSASPLQGQLIDATLQTYYNPATSMSLNSSITTTYSFPISGASLSDASFSLGMEQSYELETEIIEQITNLRYSEKREDALQELSKRRETFPRLAPLLWYSPGTVAILYFLFFLLL